MRAGDKVATDVHVLFKKGVVLYDVRVAFHVLSNRVSCIVRFHNPKQSL
jgi:hypothetical protein